jgi:chaperonin cofactor prefoldin
MLVNDLKSDLTAYKKANAGPVSQSSILDGDLLTQEISAQKKLKNTIDQQISDYESILGQFGSYYVEQQTSNPITPLREQSDSLKSEIEILEWQQKALQDFADATNGLFSDSVHALSDLARCVKAISGATYTPDKGFTFPSEIDTNCFADLKNDKLTNGKSSAVYPEHGPYGGNQDEIVNDFENGTAAEKSEIEKIIHKYHPDWSDSKIMAFLSQLQSEGCGYVAMINTFLNQYKGSEADFEKEFGFPLYITVEGKRQLNYDCIIIDFYLSEDNHNPTGYRQPSDSIDPNEADGMTFDQSVYRFEEYMKDHGVSVDVIDKLENLTGGGTGMIRGTAANYEEYKSMGQIVVEVNPVKLRYPSGGSRPEQDGGHMMTVTGVTKDGWLIVSSWGQKYYLNPADYTPTQECYLEVVKYGK